MANISAKKSAWVVGILVAVVALIPTVVYDFGNGSDVNFERSLTPILIPLAALIGLVAGGLVLLFHKMVMPNLKKLMTTTVSPEAYAQIIGILVGVGVFTFAVLSGDLSGSDVNFNRSLTPFFALSAALLGFVAWGLMLLFYKIVKIIKK